jgi:N-acetylglucosamine-6-phosphate deacetylase
MIVLAGGDLVLPDGVRAGAWLVIDGARILAITAAAGSGAGPVPAGATVVDASDCYVVPGFVDVHVHGVEGADALDAGDPIAGIAARLPRYGVTAFYQAGTQIRKTNYNGRIWS